MTSCRESGGRVEAVEALPQSAAPSSARVEPAVGEDRSAGPEPRRRGDEDVESILEFGLFGPVLPAPEGVVYESDCRFENDPYEACL